MANMELNCLSVITCGSISIRIFCPGMDKLALDDTKHEKKYPVLWLLHDDGGAAIDWLETPAERMAEKYGIFIIAPDQHHCMGTDMVYGARYEYFMSHELLGICRNNLPISEDPKENWVGGVGTGAYGALKLVLKHPETFSKAISINGILDMEAMFKKAVKGESTGTPHNKASLEAVFGELEDFHGSSNDLYALANKDAGDKVLFLWEADCSVSEENRCMAQLMGAETKIFEADDDLSSCQRSLPAGIRWLVNGK